MLRLREYVPKRVINNAFTLSLSRQLRKTIKRNRPLRCDVTSQSWCKTYSSRRICSRAIIQRGSAIDSFDFRSRIERQSREMRDRVQTAAEKRGEEEKVIPRSSWPRAPRRKSGLPPPCQIGECRSISTAGHHGSRITVNLQTGCKTSVEVETKRHGLTAAAAAAPAIDSIEVPAHIAMPTFPPQG